LVPKGVDTSRLVHAGWRGGRDVSDGVPNVFWLVGSAVAANDPTYSLYA